MIEIIGDWSTPVLLLVCFVTFIILWMSQRSSNSPPGPTGLPYIGNLIPLLKSVRNSTFVEYTTELHQQYGSIFCFNAGVQRFVFINDGKLLGELFQGDDFTSRPVKTLPVLNRMAHGSQRGILFSNGEPHKEMRRFALLSLRDFGVGKKSLDEMIQTEASILCQHLEAVAESKDGIMSGLKITMQHATANVIHHILFGFRNEYDEPKWKDLVQTLYDQFAINPLGFPENFFPVLQSFPRLNSYLSQKRSETFFRLNDSLERYINSQIEDHRSTYVEGETRDFIDLYLKYEKEEKELYTKENIFAVITDLFRAGSDTAATTMTWSVMHLVNHPEIQQQLRDEIDKMVGDRQFDRKDKDQLVKTRAFINEVHRYVTIVAAIAPHTPTKPVKVKDYVLYPGDIVIGSLHNIHHNKEYWGDPFTFCMERWINEKGELVKHDGFFHPFSIGKRACPGRQFATIEVMLILVQFLQNFIFEKAAGYPGTSDEANIGIIRAPKDFHFKVTKRQ